MKAFLSHSSKDKALVEAVAENLGTAQVELDSDTFEAGILNVETILKSLKNCSIFVLFLTEDAIKSSYVRFEALQAQELMAKGVIEKFLVFCLDESAFSQAQESWKSYSFVRHLNSAQPIARNIQHHLIVDRAVTSSKTQPYIARDKELEQLKEDLIQPGKPNVSGIYISGNAGIGRRTLARRLYMDRFPSVNSVFPEIQIDPIDGYDEIYKKIIGELISNERLAQTRARITAFAIADDKGKATQIAQILDQLGSTREAIFVHDMGGLLDSDGAYQTPFKEIIKKIDAKGHPKLIFIGRRMIPKAKRAATNIIYCPLPSMTDSQIRQLAAFLLSDAEITYTDEELEHVVALSDGHPFNVKFIVEAATEYSLQAALGDTTGLMQWKAKQGSDFLRNIEYSDEQKLILSALKDFHLLDFDTLNKIVGKQISTTAQAIIKLIDLHIIENISEAYQVSPPLITAIRRDNRLKLEPKSQRSILQIVSGILKTPSDEDRISVSMIDAGILATLQDGKKVPDLFSMFLMPSHLLWLAKRNYDSKHWAMCEKLAAQALESQSRLSPAGKAEGCVLLCLSSARLNHQDKFNDGLRLLKTCAHDSHSRSNVHFLPGFNARLDGNLPLAEEHFRKAYKIAPGNFSNIRELASVCLTRGKVEEAEKHARQVLNTAYDNPYILDILLRALIAGDSQKVSKNTHEIDDLFEKLQKVGEGDGRSFYTTRRAEFELHHGSIQEACKLIDIAVKQTPKIFGVHELRAKIYLERNIKNTARNEIDIMNKMVYRNNSGDRHTHARHLYEIEASYLAAIGDYESAKAKYGNRKLFTDNEALERIKIIEYEQAMSQTK